MPQTADTGKSPRRSASRPRKGAVAAAPSVWPASARPASPMGACCAATSSTVRLIIPCGRRAHASAAASLRSVRCASRSRYGPLARAGALITADSREREPGSCARSDQAEPGDPAPERAACHADVEGELLVPLKPHPADGSRLDRHVDLAPRAVAKRLVTMLPDIPGANRRHHLVVEAHRCGRIGIGLPEPPDFVLIRRV